MPETIFVISDLHIGAGTLDDCDPELQGCLVGFLQDLASHDSPVELVINGDFLDFAQAEPWRSDPKGGLLLESQTETGIPLCFTEWQSVQKLEAIAAAHAPIFTALNRLLASNADNRLVVIPGNHDADFFWPKVQDLFSEKVCGPATHLAKRIEFHLARVYRPARARDVWIEHGNHYDPLNSFLVKEVDPDLGSYRDPKLFWDAENPPIFRDRNNEERLYECIGTRFLIKYLNGLDAAYPFVDNVKPFSRFVRIFGASALAPGHGPLKAAMAVWGMLRYLGASALTNPGDMLSHREATDAGASALLRDLIGGMTVKERREFDRRLEERGFVINAPLQDYVGTPRNAVALMSLLSEDTDLVDGLGVRRRSLLGAGGTGGTLSMAAGFNVDETLELKKAARKTLDGNEGVGAVVMGHTHQVVNDPRYVNTGSWTRYFTFAGGESSRAWDILRENSYEIFPYQLNYVEILPGSPETVQRRIYRKKDKS